ncbi:MAG: hypothetical protein J6V90_08080 [Treponema sp.]|nr:hypothetical protein [Treponema sp.]
MEFDKSRVYTAANADELKERSTVIVADSLFSLKLKVEKGAYFSKLERVLSENEEYRFQVASGEWLLAYLVEPPKEKVLKWTDLNVGDIIRTKDGSETALVIRINNDSPDGHINIGYWLKDKDLEKYWEKKEN